MAGHHVVIGSWDQGRRKGEPYLRLYEARCDPCRWRSEHTLHLWQARTWADAHQGIEPAQAPPWARGPGRTQ